ncbi:hypothetical protein RIF25_16160 [Thermosynechococcaceae cyanobacterium BACA0444]|uniref:Uncharacterized protein n=1 Tax=Pseudocalidococcus azoricus BACA0444 TaxID=2918990 RepID=A0AAE4JXB1_9CYAN|nr:hypothetical protein [Pseudocalidococcus azoricus]MDS3862335.1 hypothetical protein [Pseudocalidococcus azoricus BACA0444]
MLTTSVWDTQPHPVASALANLLNSVLVPRNIRATVTHQAWGIHITLNAIQRINPAPATSLIQKALDKLNLQDSLTVHLQARCLGIPDWQTQFEFTGSNPAPETPPAQAKQEIQPFKPTTEKRPLAAKTFVKRQPTPNPGKQPPIPLTLESFFAPGRTSPEPLELAPTHHDNNPTSASEPLNSIEALSAFDPDPPAMPAAARETPSEPATPAHPELTTAALLTHIEAKLEEIVADQFAGLIPENNAIPPANQELPTIQPPLAEAFPVLEAIASPEIPALDPHPPGLATPPPPIEPKPGLDSLTTDLWDAELSPGPNPPQAPESLAPQPDDSTPPRKKTPDQATPDLDPAQNFNILPKYTIPKIERVPRDQEAKVVGLTGLVMGVGFCATGLGTVIGLPMVIGGAYMLGDQEVLRGACPHCGQPLKVTLGKMWRFSCPTCQGLVQIKNGRFYQVIQH